MVVALFLLIFLVILVLSILIYYRKLRLNENEHIVVITGCDSGLGESIAIALTQRGYKVVASCLTQEGVDRLSKYVSLAIKCDVTKDDEVIELSTQVKEYIEEKRKVKQNVCLWAVINNAGIADSGAIDWLSMETVRRVMDVNYFGTASICRAFLPLLKQTMHSRIINISSAAGFVPLVYGGAYCASKFAVQGYSRCLRFEMRPFKVKVCTINPSFLKTPLLNTSASYALKAFEKAPKDRTADYSAEGIKNFISLMNTYVEDPVVVVSCVLKLMYQKEPSFINTPGYGGIFSRMIASLHPIFQEFCITVFTYIMKIHPYSKHSMKKKRETIEMKKSDPSIYR